MAEPQQEPQQAMAQPQQRMAAPFPAPPPFYQHFTPENLQELRRRRKEAGVPTKPPADVTSRPDIDVLSLPTELRYLEPPPPPPTDGKFKTFGLERSLNAPEPSLSDQTYSHIPKLYPHHPSVLLNPQSHLISLARSQLTTFLLLIGNLSQDPVEGWQDATKDMEALTYNMHDLINQYRPHQARETLILMMEERDEKMRGEILTITEGRRKMQELTGRLREGGDAVVVGREGNMDVDGKDGGSDADFERRKTRQRDAWKVLEGMGRA